MSWRRNSGYEYGPENGITRECTLKKVLYVPKLAYNLVSVPRAVDTKKTVHFNDASCEFWNESGEIMAFCVREGSLYYLNCTMKSQESVNVAQEESKERLWHRRFGHLNEQSTQKLVKKGMVNKLDYDTSCEIGICEACIGGKQCKNSLMSSMTETSVPLELVHSDVCGKIGHKSLAGAEYFLTFLDDKTHYMDISPQNQRSGIQAFHGMAGRSGKFYKLESKNF